MSWVKMKVGRRPEEDVERASAVREAIGNTGLMVDANGAYHLQQSRRLAESFAELGVTWFEEPLKSTALPGLRQLRSLLPPVWR